MLLSFHSKLDSRRNRTSIHCYRGNRANSLLYLIHSQSYLRASVHSLHPSPSPKTRCTRPKNASPQVGQQSIARPCRDQQRISKRSSRFPRNQFPPVVIPALSPSSIAHLPPIIFARGRAKRRDEGLRAGKGNSPEREVPSSRVQ